MSTEALDQLTYVYTSRNASLFPFPRESFVSPVGGYRNVREEDWKERVLRGAAGGTLEIWHREITQESTGSASDKATGNMRKCFELALSFDQIDSWSIVVREASSSN